MYEESPADTGADVATDAPDAGIDAINDNTTGEDAPAEDAITNYTY